jgi:alpha-tubulin suppressor-like RCC1 family protein
VIGDVAAIAAGAYHTCALLRSGGVSCWGRNEYGQLGDGTETDRPSPMAITVCPAR